MKSLIHARRSLLPVLLLLLLAACARQTPPDLVLVSLDTVRADSFAEAAARSPTLARLIAGGVSFRAAATPTPLTLPAHVSLLSGLDPDHHGVRNNGQRLGDGVELLAEHLQEAGYSTHAVVSAFPLDRQFGLARGFDSFDQPPAPASESSGFATLERSAAQSLDAALTVLPALPQTQPQLLWLHLFDAHAPYAAPGSDPAQPAQARYLDEIVYMGDQLQRLLARLEQRGRPYVLVVLADHGEGLGDHGELDHGLLLFDSTVLVPMLWYAPGRLDPQRIEQTARLIDVMPTLLQLAGATLARPVDGISLLPWLEGSDAPLPTAYAESYYAHYAYQHAPLRSLRDGNWKLIASETDSELFNLLDDPAESRDLHERELARVERMHFDVWQRAELGPSAAAADPAALRKLQSLGYVAPGATSLDSPAAGRHPREIAAAHRRLVELQNLLGEGRHEAALEAAQRLHADQPDNSFAAYVLGVLQMDNGAFAAAAQSLESAARLDPGNAQTHFKLADALLRSGQPAAALAQWQLLEVLDPQRIAVWTNEAATLAALEQWPDAWTAVNQALRLSPDDPAALDNATAIAERLGRWPDAADLYQRQSAIAGFSQQGRLALALLRAGRLEQARRAAEVQLPPGSGQLGALLIVRAVVASRQSRHGDSQAALEQLRQRFPQLLNRAQAEFVELRGR